ncbi:MAG TPA: hypothetical protein VF047_09700 [Nitrososphaeraceae archaeon]
MQREKIDRNFLKFWKNIIHELSFKKTIPYRIIINDVFVLRKIIPYIFSGFSLTFIGYIIINILNNYPPREIGISP